jgi:L-lactate dehydrogenase complex protein LldG
MNKSGARKYIIDKLKNSSAEEQVNNPVLSAIEPLYPDEVYNSEKDIPEIIFANQLKLMAGKFVFAENIKELQEQLYSIYIKEKWESIFCLDKKLIEVFESTEIKFTKKTQDFDKMKAGITSCEYLVARFGSVVVSSKQESGRRMNIFPPVHIVIAYSYQIVMEPEDALEKIRNKYKDNIPSLISVITGPSRTADIEKTLVMGAHGPKELYVFLVNDK